jgi:hypothetical protein
MPENIIEKPMRLVTETITTVPMPEAVTTSISRVSKAEADAALMA